MIDACHGLYQWVRIISVSDASQRHLDDLFVAVFNIMVHYDMFLCVHFIIKPVNPMDKGHYKYYGRNSNMVSSVTIIGYIMFCTTGMH